MYVISSILMAVGIVVLWVHWLNAEMGGGDRRRVVVPTAPVVMVEHTDVQPARATPYQLWGSPTVPPAATPYQLWPGVDPAVSDGPVATLTPVPVVAVPTWVPSPVPPTVTEGPSRPVQVLVRAYWPDDSPEWCLTWNAEEGLCVSPLYSGDDWHTLTGRAWACDIRWYGRELDVSGIGRGLCLDVGETFVCSDHEALCTVGLLSPLPVGEDNVIYSGVLYGDLGRWAPVG